jgi:hypothetical protein
MIFVNILPKSGLCNIDSKYRSLVLETLWHLNHLFFVVFVYNSFRFL